MSDIIFLNTFKENFEKHKNKRIVLWNKINRGKFSGF